MIDLSVSEILMRLLATIIASSLIGYERELRGNDAGLRTHALVALGACIFALIQIEIVYHAIEINMKYEDAIVAADTTRIIAQVVSGVGFLGAGSIMMTKAKIRGLTTAASIWATAALGVGFGLGFFLIMSLSTVTILITLVIFKKLFRVPVPTSFEIKYREQPELSGKILMYFRQNNIPVLNNNYYYELKENVIHHTNHYTIDTSKVEHKSILFEGLFSVGEIDEIKSLYLEMQ